METQIKIRKPNRKPDPKIKKLRQELNKPSGEVKIRGKVCLPKGSLFDLLKLADAQKKADNP